MKDTKHALTIFSSVQLSSDRTYRLFLLDVCSLYTSIPRADGLRALQFFLDKSPHPSVSTSTLIRLAELVLTLNSFEFDGHFFDQISGVAMGTKMGPSYACLFMGHLEHLVWSTYDGPFPPLFHRYIDDGIGITDMSEVELTRFINFIGSFNPAIQFTSNISTTSVNFLDIIVTIHLPYLSTSVYYKPTDAHGFLLYTSSHPPACRNSLPYSQLLRLRRLCSDYDDFLDRSSEMIEFFRRRSFPDSILSSAWLRVRHLSRLDTLTDSQSSSSSSDRVKLVLTFHPHNFSVRRIMLKHYSLLQSDPDTRAAFHDLPLVAYRRDKNLKDNLVHSHLKSSVPDHFGTVRCSRGRCYTCPYVVQMRSISFPKATFSIDEAFTCESRNVIYVIICKRCGKQYIGETGLRLSDRFCNHLHAIKHRTPTPVATHFNGDDHHGALDIQVTAIRSCTTDDRSRYALENRLIFELGTLKPFGLNSDHSFV